jgi:hypothetical protein
MFGVVKFIDGIRTLSCRVGDGQPVISSTVDCKSIPPAPRPSFDSRLSAPRFGTLGVGQPVQPLSDVRCLDARSAGITRPAGVTLALTVSEYSIEPREAILRSHLLTHDDGRSARFDEAEEFRPEVPLVLRAFALACGAEWLAWTASRPTLSLRWPFGKLQCETPSCDACEEVTLPKPGKVAWRNFLN